MKYKFDEYNFDKAFDMDSRQLQNISLIDALVDLAICYIDLLTKDIMSLENKKIFSYGVQGKFVVNHYDYYYQKYVSSLSRLVEEFEYVGYEYSDDLNELLNTTWVDFIYSKEEARTFRVMLKHFRNKALHNLDTTGQMVKKRLLLYAFKGKALSRMYGVHYHLYNELMPVFNEMFYTKLLLPKFIDVLGFKSGKEAMQYIKNNRDFLPVNIKLFNE